MLKTIVMFCVSYFYSSTVAGYYSFIGKKVGKQEKGLCVPIVL